MLSNVGQNYLLEWPSLPSKLLQFYEATFAGESQWNPGGRRQAGRKSEIWLSGRKSAKRKSSSAADGPVATETDAGRPAMVAHRWVAPQIHKNVQTQISNRTNTQIFQFADLAEQRRRRKHIMLITTNNNNNNKLEKPIILISSFLYSVHWATGA